MLRGRYLLPTTLPSGVYDLVTKLDRHDGRTNQKIEGGRGNGHRLVPTVSSSAPVAKYLRHRRSGKLHAGDMQEFTTQTTKPRFSPRGFLR
jgi:hypothetical protein